MAGSEIVIEAIVGEPEREAVHTAAVHLREAFGPGWTVTLRIPEKDAKPGEGVRASAIVRSLFREAESKDDIPAVQNRLAEELRTLSARADAVFLMTVFRSVRSVAGWDRGSPLLERIRRLDLLAVELSHDCGMAVIDIDRAFA